MSTSLRPAVTSVLTRVSPIPCAYRRNTVAATSPPWIACLLARAVPEGEVNHRQTPPSPRISTILPGRCIVATQSSSIILTSTTASQAVEAPLNLIDSHRTTSQGPRHLLCFPWDTIFNDPTFPFTAVIAAAATLLPSIVTRAFYCPELHVLRYKPPTLSRISHRVCPINPLSTNRTSTIPTPSLLRPHP